PKAPTPNYVEDIIDHTRNHYSLAALAARAPAAPTPAPEEAQEDAHPQMLPVPVPEPTAQSQTHYRPSREALCPAIEKEFVTKKEKALYFISQAHYLTTKQIIKLCYSHVAANAQATTASRALRDLVQQKKIKEQFFSKEKVYYIGATCDPTKHNLG